MLFLSLHPRPVQAKTKAGKTAELRKRRLGIEPGCIVFIDATTPNTKLSA